uniref:Thioredoxin domain-containing protein n=1 Tax=viral metagenome TaxID=1070528 RepID=A0A6C0CQA3_9ZZZZ
MAKSKLSTKASSVAKKAKSALSSAAKKARSSALGKTVSSAASKALASSTGKKIKGAMSSMRNKIQGLLKNPKDFKKQLKNLFSFRTYIHVFVILILIIFIVLEFAGISITRLAILFVMVFTYIFEGYISSSIYSVLSNLNSTVTTAADVVDTADAASSDLNKVFQNSTATEAFDVTNNNETSIILVKATWCSVCTNYLKSDQWATLVATVQASNYAVYVIDLDQNADLIPSLLTIPVSNITHVPMLFLKYNSTVYNYEGDLNNPQEIVNTLAQMVNP